MTDAALDMSIAGMTPAPRNAAAPASPWHARRLEGFGASDVAVLLAVTGRREMSTLPRYLADKAKPLRTKHGPAPRVVLERCGRPETKAGPAADIGKARERELLDAWAATLTPFDDVEPASLRHSSDAPGWVWPYPDRRCPRLAASLDAWGRDSWGDDIAIELKCSRAVRDALPWYWAAQVQAQLAASGLGLGLVVCGQEWSRSMTSTGPIDAWPVDRDEHVIDEIRASVVEAWAMVEKHREAMR